jgi:hydrogenase maturation protease
MAKTLILGIGNPILRDDGVGLCVADKLGQLISNPGVVVEQTTLAGVNLIELMTGFEAMIAIDAIQGDSRPGEVKRLHLEDFRDIPRPSIQHGLGLLEAIIMGKALKRPMPVSLDIITIQVEDAIHFGDELTPAVKRSVPIAVNMVLNILEEYHLLCPAAPE